MSQTTTTAELDLLAGMQRLLRQLEQMSLRAEECRVVLEDLPMPESYTHPLAQEAARIARDALRRAAESADYNAEAIAKIEAFMRGKNGDAR